MKRTSASRDHCSGVGSTHVRCGADGREVIESYSITGMGHGTLMEIGSIDGVGRRGSYMLDVHISSTLRVARFRGIAPTVPISTLVA